MRVLILVLFLLGSAMQATPAEAGHGRDRPAGYHDADGNFHPAYRSSTSQWRRDRARYDRRVRAHRRRRNVLLGVGGLGLITGSRALSIIGLGGAAANHFVDDEHRDY